MILAGVSGAECVFSKVVSEFCDCAEDEGVVEVDVLDTLWVALEALDVAVKVWSLVPKMLG